MRRTATTRVPDKRQAIESARTDTARGAGVRNMQPLIQLRWIALVGQLATILFVHFVLGIALPLATMLGVQRPTVTVVLRSLHKAGLIRETRGLVEIRDRRGLERACCECYGLMRDEQRRLLGY